MFGVAYARSADGLSWEKPNLGLVNFLNSTDNNLICVGCNGLGVMLDLQEKNASRRYKAFGGWENLTAHTAMCRSPQGCVNPHDIETSLGAGGSGSIAFSPDGLTWSANDLASIATEVSPFGCPGHCAPLVETKRKNTGGCNCSFGLGMRKC